MSDTTKLFDFNKIFKSIIDTQSLYLLLAFLLLLDVYFLNVFKKGFIDINIPDIFNVSIIKHIIFVTIILAIINNIIVKFIDLLRLCKKKYQTNCEYYDVVEREAIDNRDNFLMSYVKDEKNRIIKSI